MSPVYKKEWIKQNIHTSRVPFTEANVYCNDDYATLSNSVQRHSKGNLIYSLRLDPQGDQYCHYPFEHSNAQQ